ncbi:type III secretion system export apparatus subunit SctU [soil metagenome]
MSGEKTKPPTAHRLKKARQDGETAVSQDFTAAVALVLPLIMLSTGAAGMADRLSLIVRLALDFSALPPEALTSRAYALGSQAAMLIIPFALAASIAGVIGVAAQGSMTMSMKKVQMKFGQADPIAGIGRLFSARTLTDGLKTVVKLVLMSTLLAFSIRSMLPLLVGATSRSPAMLASLLWDLSLKLMFTAAVFIGVAAAIDFKLQRWLFIRDKRMSEEEVKREGKDLNGNPEIKSKQKELAREAANETPGGATARPDVVLANPTHYSVALSYTRGQGVPTVVAKGEDEKALALRLWAQNAFVPVIEQPALARRLYLVEVGHPVPPETYQAVAVVLQWVRAIGSSAPAQRVP